MSLGICVSQSAVLHIVSLHRATAAHRISLSGKGNVLYPVLSSFNIKHFSSLSSMLTAVSFCLNSWTLPVYQTVSDVALLVDLSICIILLYFTATEYRNCLAQPAARSCFDIVVTL